MLRAYSWTVYQDEEIAEKIVDLSLMLNGVTGIPKEIRPFFRIDHLGKKKWTLKIYLSNVNDDQFYRGVVTVVNERTRLTFENHLIHLLRKAYPEHYQYFLNRKSSQHELGKKLKDVRIRLYKKGTSQEPAMDSSLSGTFEISFPDSSEKRFDTNPSDLLFGMEWNEKNEYREGKKRLYSHLVRERDRRVIRVAIKKAKERYGKVFCEVCGFDFFQMYGEYGIDFIECHHKIPLAERDDLGSITKIEDIALLCANCHRMIHRKRNHVLRVEELKQIIRHRWYM